MPTKLANLPTATTDRLRALGATLRQQRKRLGVSATVAAESAGMSRLTWYRMEQGSPAVTIGAYLQALTVLGLDMELRQAATRDAAEPVGKPGWIPTRITLADYPQLQQLAWHVHGSNTFTLGPREALDIYERHGRHLDTAALSPQERELLEALQDVFGNTHGI